MNWYQGQVALMTLYHDLSYTLFVSCTSDSKYISPLSSKTFHYWCVKVFHKEKNLINSLIRLTSLSVSHLLLFVCYSCHYLCHSYWNCYTYYKITYTKPVLCLGNHNGKCCFLSVLNTRSEHFKNIKIWIFINKIEIGLWTKQRIWKKL